MNGRNELRDRLAKALYDATWDGPGWINAAEVEQAFTRQQIDAILAEIERTHRIVERKGSYAGPKHGTLGCYSYHHCRCDACRGANAQRSKEVRAKEREKRAREG